MKNILDKFKIYGPRKFLLYAFLEAKRILLLQFIKKSFSQYGEDLIIDSLLHNKHRGFYVDVGAYDPKRFSNTYRFYKKGWCGINIEPDTTNYNKFLAKRKRDINLNIGVGNGKQSLVFYKFVPDTLSTFSKSEAQKYIANGYKLVSKKTIPVDTLSSIFNTYVKSKKIDLLSVDTEGYDMEVLKSSNWKKYRPIVVCVETADHIKGTKNGRARNVKIEDFLNLKNYRLHVNVGTDSIFIDKFYR